VCVIETSSDRVAAAVGCAERLVQSGGVRADDRGAGDVPSGRGGCQWDGRALELLADGSFAVVFEEFTITNAEHTNVILVSYTDVTADADIDQTKIVDLGPLTGTTGMQDCKVPAEMTPGAMGYHTVVLWDTAMKHAIAAAPLTLK
jgi:hypothetical protein